MEGAVVADTPQFKHEWPPFPQPPPGTVIIPFTQYKPKGIIINAIESEEEEHKELDGHGIPTVRLVKDTGKPKKLFINGRRAEWHVEWAVDEKSHRAIVDPNLNRIDRLHQIANDFKQGRLWPPPTQEGNVSLLWDYWRLFLGLISNIAPEPRKGKVDYDPSQDLESDDEANPKPANDQAKPTTVAVVDDPEKRKKMEGERRNNGTPKPLDDEAYERIQRARDRRDGRKDFFLNDPELSVKIFLSSRFRDKGYIYNDTHCFEAPKLLQFFLQFCLRSNAFPEEKAGLQRALRLCERAERELPGTGKLGKAVPDSLNRGLQDLNGMMTTGMFGTGISFGDDDSDSDDSGDEEPAAKKQRTDDAVRDFIAAQPGMQMVDLSQMDLDGAGVRDAVRDNVDQNGVEVQPGSGWGDIKDSGGWGVEVPAGWGDEDDRDVTGWQMELKNDVLKDLGPTALPFTHTTGIVERSTRKIERVVRPRDAAPATTPAFASQTEAIEDDLETKLGYMILSPWVKIGNHVGSDIIKPFILPDSRGPVIVPKLTSSDERNHGIPKLTRDASPPSDGYADAGPPFDPVTDKIRVLVSPDAIEELENHVGMGVNATWVQLARKEQPGDDEAVGAGSVWRSKKKRERNPRRGAPGKYGSPTQWWYMEQVGFTLTSFHTDMYYADQE